ncbi:MAG: phosphopantetheine-binding protein [Myxococcota bacterium]
MSPDAVRTQIVTVVREELKFAGPLPEGDLTEALDSIQRLALVVAIEDHFEICFDPDDDAQATTLDDVVGIVVRRLAAKP